MAGKRAPGGGRKRKPTALHVLHGTHRKDRANKDEPQPAKISGGARPPHGFDATERRCWKALVRELEGMGVLTVVDGGALELLVGATVRYRRLKRRIEKDGETLTDQNARVYRNPAALAMREAHAQCVRLRVEFGLTPSSRSRVSVAPIAPPRDDAASFFDDAPPAAGAG